MKRAQVLTPWIGDGRSADSANRAAVGDAYTLERWTDVTGQPAENLQPDPNLLAVEIVCEDAVLAQIDADPDYEILWSEDA